MPVDILECLEEMLVSGTMASMVRTRLYVVREVFTLMGVEDSLAIKTESVMHDMGGNDGFRIYNIGNCFQT